MRIPKRRREYGLRVNLTPLNDIVFLLIIFLVASPHFKPSEQKTDVELPLVALHRDETSRTERRLEVTVTQTAEFLVGGEPISREDLKRRIRQAGAQNRQIPGLFELRIRTDRRAEYGVIEPILKTCAKAGITDIKFAALPQQSG